MTQIGQGDQVARSRSSGFIIRRFAISSDAAAANRSANQQPFDAGRVVQRRAFCTPVKIAAKRPVTSRCAGVGHDVQSDLFRVGPAASRPGVRGSSARLSGRWTRAEQDGGSSPCDEIDQFATAASHSPAEHGLYFGSKIGRNRRTAKPSRPPGPGVIRPRADAVHRRQQVLRYSAGGWPMTKAVDRRVSAAFRVPATAAAASS